MTRLIQFSSLRFAEPVYLWLLMAPAILLCGWCGCAEGGALCLCSFHQASGKNCMGSCQCFGCNLSGIFGSVAC